MERKKGIKLKPEKVDLRSSSWIYIRRKKETNIYRYTENNTYIQRERCMKRSGSKFGSSASSSIIILHPRPTGKSSKMHFRIFSTSNLRFRRLDRVHHQLFDARKDRELAARLPPHFELRN